MFLVVVAAATLAFLRRRVEWGAGWVWPVPSFRAKDGTVYDAVISSGIGTPRGAGLHRGVDVMYRRRSRSDRPEYKPKTSDGSPMHFAPPLTPVVAARDGVIWSASKTPRGWSVVIDHGKPFATYYTHLDHLAWPDAFANGRSVATGARKRVKAGDVIGSMGADPQDKAKLRHLHFAVWHGGTDSHAVDPEPAMREWARVPWLFEQG